MIDKPYRDTFRRVYNFYRACVWDSFCSAKPASVSITISDKENNCDYICLPVLPHKYDFYLFEDLVKNNISFKIKGMTYYDLWAKEVILKNGFKMSFEFIDKPPLSLISSPNKICTISEQHKSYDVLYKKYRQEASKIFFEKIAESDSPLLI